MCMDPTTEQHQQDMGWNETLESMLICTKAASREVDNKKPRPQDEEAQKCPRCDSSNTKFCYYNNYSLTQPRYFCKSCRRYWTKGGTLRNVPVGGGCRKNNKRSTSSSFSSNSSASSKIRTIDEDHHHPQRPLIASNHNHSLLPYESTDLSLAFATLQNAQLGFDHGHDNHHISLLGNYSNNVHGSFLDTLRCGNFLETPPINEGLENVYYGEDHHYENGGNYTSHEEIRDLPYEDVMRGGSGGSSAISAVNVTSVKQDERAEGCNKSSDATTEDGYGGIMMNDVDAIGSQSSWIKDFASSNWHGFLSSPLM